jgi:hypothetical protein
VCLRYYPLLDSNSDYVDPDSGGDDCDDNYHVHVNNDVHNDVDIEYDHHHHNVHDYPYYHNHHHTITTTTLCVLKWCYKGVTVDLW